MTASLFLPTPTHAQLGMYDPERRSDIQYEVVKLPLQDQVAVVRKATCTVWRDAKVRYIHHSHICDCTS